MNQKTNAKKNLHRARISVATSKERITPTTLQKIGFNISRFLDQMNDPKYKDEKFRQIFTQINKKSELCASNEDMSIYFTIEWKGGLQ